MENLIEWILVGSTGLCMIGLVLAYAFEIEIKKASYGKR